MPQSISVSQGPPQEAFTQMVAVDANNNPEYIGIAASRQLEYEASVNNGLLTSIVVAANVGTVTMANHGLQVGNTVIVSGATVAPALNGTYAVASIVDGNSFTITTAGVANGNYTDAGLVLKTQAPRTNQQVWAIQRHFYDVGGNLVRSTWAHGQSQMYYVWDSRTTYPYN